MIIKLEMKLEPSLGPGSSVGEREKIGNETANKSVSEASQSGRFGRVKGPLSSRLASFANFFGLSRFFFSPNLVPGYTAPSQGRLLSSNLSISTWTIASTQSPETCNPRSNIILTGTFGDSTVDTTFFRVSSPLGPTSRHDLPPQFWLHESHREYHGHMDNLLGFLFVLWFNFALGLISIFLCPILVIITLPNLVPRSHSVLH